MDFIRLFYMRQKEASKYLILLFLLYHLIMLSCERYLPIHEAVRDGDIEQVRRILAENPKSVNSREPGEFGYTPLGIAVGKGDQEMVQVLLDAGSDVNQECYVQTPLTIAAGRGDVTIAKMLLSKGALVETERASDEPIIEAAAGGSTEIVRLLLTKGANANAMRKAGRGNTRDSILLTPLKAAAQYGHADVIELLLKSGANINAKFENDWSALHLAVMAHAKDPINAVEVLLAAGAEINARGFRGKTPLHIAVEGKELYDPVKDSYYFEPVDLEIVKSLIEKGAQINAKDDEGHTPLYYALKNHHTQIIEFLQKNGAR